MNEQQARVTAGSVRAGGLGVFLVAFVLLGLGAWDRDLFDADEGRYASVAVTMVRSGDWVVPHLNGMPFMDKPPLVYWVQAVPTRLAGPHEIFARLPTLLAGALWTLMIWLLALAWTGDRSKAAWSALLAATSAAGMLGSRVGPQMDMPLAACVATALYAGWRGIALRGWGSQVLLGVAVGCGLLVKGPLVAAVPFLVAVAWGCAGVPWSRVLRTMFAPLSWGVALAIAAPWYVLVEQAQPGWIQHFITYEHFGRFTQGDHRSFHPAWFYVPIALLYLAPWTPLAWGGLARVRRGGRLGRPLLGVLACSPWAPWTWDAALPEEVAVSGRRVRAGRLAWLWFLAAFLLYSMATRKLLNYLLPAAAPLFVLVGARFAGLLERGRTRAALVMPALFAVALLVAGLLVAAGWWFPFATGRLPSSLEAPRWSAAGPALLVGALLLGVGLALHRAWRGLATRSAVALVLGCACAWWSIDFGLARIAGIGSSRGLAAALEQHVSDAEVLVSLKRYPQGLAFYGGPRLWIAGGTPEDWEQREIVNPYARRAWEAAGGAASQPGPAQGGGGPRGGLLTSAQFDALWSGPRSVLVICRWGEVKHLGGELLGGPYGGGGRTDLFLVRNRPPPARAGD